MGVHSTEAEFQIPRDAGGWGQSLLGRHPPLLGDEGLSPAACPGTHTRTHTHTRRSGMLPSPSLGTHGAQHAWDSLTMALRLQNIGLWGRAGVQEPPSSGAPTPIRTRPTHLHPSPSAQGNTVSV